MVSASTSTVLGFSMTSTTADTVRIALVVIAAVVLIGRRLYGQPVQPLRLFAMPPVLILLGCSDFAKAERGHHLTATDIAFLAVSALLALAIGVYRGATVALFERDGVLWMRYRPATLALWLLLTAGRFLIGFAGAAAGSRVAAANTSLLIMLGLTLLPEAAVIALRSSSLGIPYAPHQSRRGLLGGGGGGVLGGTRRGGTIGSRRGGRGGLLR